MCCFLSLVTCHPERDFKCPPVPKSTTQYDTFKNKTKKLDVGSILSTRDLQRHLFKQQKHTHLFPPFTYELTQYSKLNFNSTYHPEFNFVLPFERSRIKANQTASSSTSVKDDEIDDRNDATSSAAQSVSSEEDELVDEEELEGATQNGYEIHPDEIETIMDKEDTKPRNTNESIERAQNDPSNNDLPHDNDSDDDDIGYLMGGDTGFSDDGLLEHHPAALNHDLRNYDTTNRKKSNRQSMSHFLEESNADILLQDDFLSNAMQSYEELCKRHLEKYMRSTDRHALDSRRIQRVNEWQTKINPVLTMQAKRSKYDIYQYGENLISHLSRYPNRNRRASSASQEPVPVNFATIAERKPTHEVCRLFLATLQLANMGNIEIEDQKTTDSFGIRLLSNEIEYTNFDHMITASNETSEDV